MELDIHRDRPHLIGQVQVDLAPDQAILDQLFHHGALHLLLDLGLQVKEELLQLALALDLQRAFELEVFAEGGDVDAQDSLLVANDEGADALVALGE